MSLPKFHVGQKVRIDLEAIKSSNRWCKTPGYPSANFIKQLESLIAEFGPIGVVTHTFEPTYELAVSVGDYPVGFHMKGHLWCFPVEQP